MLGALACGDQAGVPRRLVEVLLHDRLPFLDDPCNAVAVFAAHLFVEAREHLLQPLDLALRFFEMQGEGLLQIGRRRRLGELRQCLGELVFGVIRITEFVDESVVQ